MGQVAVLIVDPHSIFRSGLATCLDELPLAFIREVRHDVVTELGARTRSHAVRPD